MDQVEIALWNCNNLLKTMNWMEEHPERVELNFVTCGTKACVFGWYQNHWHAHHLHFNEWDAINEHFHFPTAPLLACLWYKLFSGSKGLTLAERKQLLKRHIANLQQELAAQQKEAA